MALRFNKEFDPAHGCAVTVAPGVVRVTAHNPSPFTFHGTNSYIVGSRTLAVIDPGPDDDAHLAALLAAIGGRPVSHILITHTHRDHSPLARRLQQRTGATTLAEGPHRPSRAARPDETSMLDAAGDVDFQPDRRLADGEDVDGDGWRLAAVLTPGHAANHAAFSLAGTGILFSGDHVMAWATTVVAPPDGAMAPFMASLDRLIARNDTLLLPGHGGPVANPRAFLRGLRSHRKMRERAILQRLKQGDSHIGELVAAIYRNTDPRLHGAAGMSVLAHLEDLAARGLVATDEPPTLSCAYRLT